MILHVPWGVVVGWCALLALLAAPAARISDLVETGGFTAPDLDSVRAAELMVDGFGLYPGALAVVFSANEGSEVRLDDPARLLEIDELLSRVRAHPDVGEMVTPRQNSRQISGDGSTAFAVIHARVPPEILRRRVPEFEAVLRTSGPFRITLVGSAVYYEEVSQITERDLRRAELLSLPIALVTLVLVFGSPVAAGLPVVVGAAGVLAATGLLALLARVLPISLFALNVVTLLGLGLGIDYALLMLNRFREESRRGSTVREAVERAVCTAGHTVAFSSLAVMVGMLALASFRYPALRSLGLAGVLVVGCCAFAALSLLPALLVLLGSHVVRRHPLPADAASRWSVIAEWVMRHPVRIVLVVGVTLLGLGIPFLHVDLGGPDASMLPYGARSREGVELLREKFGPGEVAPLLLVLRWEGRLTPERVGALYDLERRILNDPQVARVESAFALDRSLTRGDWERLAVTPATEVESSRRRALGAFVRENLAFALVTSRDTQSHEATRELLGRLRTLPTPVGTELFVGGGTAEGVDYGDGLKRDIPHGLLLLGVATFVLLFALFRSIVLPLKAMLVNVVSMAASFGVLVSVFQDGHFSTQLGVSAPGFIDASTPVILFCLLFGVSMDYQVFLLSRIVDGHRAGLDNRQSVVHGLVTTAGTITGGAAVLVVVGGAFLSAELVFVKAFALGAVVAIVLDATLVRVLLVPAMMRLLGDWNWWRPGLPWPPGFATRRDRE